MKKQKREFWCYEFPLYEVELDLKVKFSGSNSKITVMDVFKYFKFPYIVVLCYYEFNILLLYECKYFLKFLWIVNSDLSFVSKKKKINIPAVSCVSLLFVTFITLLHPLLHSLTTILNIFKLRIKIKPKVASVSNATF